MLASRPLAVRPLFAGPLPVRRIAGQWAGSAFASITRRPVIRHRGQRPLSVDGGFSPLGTASRAHPGWCYGEVIRNARREPTTSGVADPPDIGLPSAS
jgi:hypothetical protein